jgi:hypothetical protein
MRIRSPSLQMEGEVNGQRREKIFYFYSCKFFSDMFFDLTIGRHTPSEPVATVLVSNLAAKSAKPANPNYFVIPYEISCQHSRL